MHDALSPEERAAFEAALEADPELRTETERQRELIHRLEAVRRRRWVAANLELRKRGNRWLWLAIAIFAVGASIAGYIYLAGKKATPPVKEPVQVLSPETPIALDTLSEPALAPKQKPPHTPQPPSKSLLAYQEALDAQEPIQYTAMGDEIEDQEAERLVNEALDLMREGRPDIAAEFLQPLLNDAGSFYRQDAEWLHALSWMPRDEDKARSMLAGIAQDYAHPYRLRALAVLEKMK